MHKKHYRERLSYGVRDKKRIVFRIILTIVLAVAFSVLFCMVGITLGKNAADGTAFTTPSEDSVTLAPNGEETTLSQFDFKDVEDVKSVGVDLGKKDKIPYDTVRIPLTDGEGKLTYLSSVSSLMYGSSFSTTLKPIAAAVNSADIKSNSVSMCFKPFVLEDNQNFADSCSLALVKELCEHDISEILLESHDISDALIQETAEYVGAYENISLGVLLPPTSFEGIVSEKEKLIKKYYSVFDFCVVDLSHIVLGTSEETSDRTDEVNSDAYRELYSLINENALLIAKYSLRIRLYAPTDEAVDEAEQLITELELDNYEIVSD